MALDYSFRNISAMHFFSAYPLESFLVISLKINSVILCKISWKFIQQFVFSANHFKFICEWHRQFYLKFLWKNLKPFLLISSELPLRIHFENILEIGLANLAVSSIIILEIGNIFCNSIANSFNNTDWEF